MHSKYRSHRRLAPRQPTARRSVGNSSAFLFLNEVFQDLFSQVKLPAVAGTAKAVAAMRMVALVADHAAQALVSLRSELLLGHVLESSYFVGNLSASEEWLNDCAILSARSCAIWTASALIVSTSAPVLDCIPGPRETISVLLRFGIGLSFLAPTWVGAFHGFLHEFAGWV